jgi:Na+-driven multidrug efflux pump
MGTDPEVLPLSAVYMRIYFGGITFNMVYNFCSSALRAAGDTKSPLLFLSIAGVVNVALNVVFVTVLHMNVAGVALATAIAHVIASVLLMRAMLNNDKNIRFYWKKMGFDTTLLKDMLKIGVPAAVQSSLFTVSNLIIKAIGLLFKIPMNHIVGDTGMGYYSHAYTLYTCFFMIATNGLPVALAMMLSESRSKGQIRQTKRIFRIALLLFVVVGFVGMSIMMIGAQAYYEFLAGNTAGMELNAYATKSILGEAL